MPCCIQCNSLKADTPFHVWQWFVRNHDLYWKMPIKEARKILARRKEAHKVLKDFDVVKGYRIRYILGKWWALMFDQTDRRCDEHALGPYDTIDQAVDHAKSTDFKDLDK